MRWREREREREGIRRKELEWSNRERKIRVKNSAKALFVDAIADAQRRSESI
jgi:hypothetical protein